MVELQPSKLVTWVRFPSPAFRLFSRGCGVWKGLEKPDIQSKMAAGGTTNFFQSSPALLPQRFARTERRKSEGPGYCIRLNIHSNNGIKIPQLFACFCDLLLLSVCIAVQRDIAFGVAGDGLQSLRIQENRGHRNEGMAEGMGRGSVQVDRLPEVPVLPFISSFCQRAITVPNQKPADCLILRGFQDLHQGRQDRDHSLPGFALRSFQNRRIAVAVINGIALDALTANDKKTADRQAAGWWWLRSPGSDQAGAANVDSDGSLCHDYVGNGRHLVRPAFWLALSSDIFF